MSRVSAVRRLRCAVSQPSVPPPDLGTINPAAYYTEAEVAFFLRLKSPKTLTIWRCRGTYPELRFIKKFGRVLYLGCAVLNFLNGTATAEPAPAKPQRRRGAR